MLIPGPDVLDRLVQQRHEHLRASAIPARSAAIDAMRVRVGKLLIAAGSSLSGERVERPVRKPAVPKAV